MGAPMLRWDSFQHFNVSTFQRRIAASTMLLYILRGAEAELKITSDHERRLTLHGHEQAKIMGQFCLERKIFPEMILTSPVIRAKQTAEEFSNVLKKGELIEVPWMACGMNPENALQELRGYKNFQSVMIVGHEPDLSGLIAMLLGISDVTGIEIMKASLTVIELRKWEPSAGVLKWSLPCELLEAKK